MPSPCLSLGVIRPRSGPVATRAMPSSPSHQLADRYRPHDDPRCRGEPRHPPGGRGLRLAHHARPNDRALRPDAWSRTAPMARSRTCRGWSSSAGSHRISWGSCTAPTPPEFRFAKCSKRDCDGCALKPRCCPNTPACNRRRCPPGLRHLR